MSQRFKLSNGAEIEAADQPFARGGEAEIYEILAPGNYTQQVLKVYNAEKRNKAKEEKLRYLIGHKPNFSDANGHHSVIWPLHLASKGGQFVGYTMHKATGEKLELLCHAKLPKNLEKTWGKFAFQSPNAIDARLKLCFNLAAALAQIHAFGNYVLVDMKPENIMVLPNGYISIIDIDSVEVLDYGKLLFPAHVATPDYTPPEYYRNQTKDLEHTVIEETWDRFSLAVIFYRLLLGIHPFTGALHPPHDGLTTFDEIIKAGFFPHGVGKSKFKKIPPPHLQFNALDKVVQQLFITALEKSHANAALRPSADDWCRVLSPNPGVQVNRTLPSKAATFFQATYSITPRLADVPAVSVQSPGLIQRPKSNPLQKLLKVFVKNERDKTLTAVMDLQRQVMDQRSHIERVASNMKAELDGLIREMNSELTTERNLISALVSTYQARAQSVDKRAQDLFQQEAKIYRDYESALHRETVVLNQQIKNEFTRLVTTHDEASNKRQQQIAQELSGLNNQERNQIQLLDNDLALKLAAIKAKIQLLEKEYAERVDGEFKESLAAVERKRLALAIKEKKVLKEALEKYQLSYATDALKQHRISDHQRSIFTDGYARPATIVANLSAYGIYTAADIKGVDASGRILTSTGKWVKVPEVATARATKLDEWRQKVTRTLASSPPQALPYSDEVRAKQTLSLERGLIDDEERKVKEAINAKKSQIPNQLSKQLEEAKKQERIVTDQIQTAKARLGQDFQTKRKLIQQKLVDAQNEAQTVKAQQTLTYNKTTQQMRDRVDELVKQKDGQIEQTKADFDQRHEKLKREIEFLNQSFVEDQREINKKTKSNIDSLSAHYESLISRYSADLKTKTASYSTLADRLVSLQSRFAALPA